MFMRIFCLTAAMLFAFPAVGMAFQGYVQPIGENGSIAWGNGEVSVVRPMFSTESTEIVKEPKEIKLDPLAVRRAVSNARKQMLDMIMSVRIDGKRTVSAYLSESDELAARVRGVVQNSPLDRPMEIGPESTIRVSEAFRGKLAELVLPTTIQFQSGIPPKLSTSMEQNFGFEGMPEEAGSGVSGYTGVIVDARGIAVTPALTPIIYGQDGLGAYGTFLVSRDNAINKGVVAYAITANPAELKERVGSNPLVVKALNAYGSWRTDLVISSSMASLVRATMRSPEAVNNCRVVIVVDAPEVPEDMMQGEEGETTSEEMQPTVTEGELGSETLPEENGTGSGSVE